MHRRHAHRLFALASIIALGVAPWCHAADSDLVRVGASGRLIYKAAANGDRIPNYAMSGYRYGESLPDVMSLLSPSRVVTVAPASGDDTAAIQNAINQVAAMSLDASGYRGVVQLTAGEYQIATQLNITASGVVLRGVGDGSSTSTNTVLRATGTSVRHLVNIGVAGSQTSTVSNTTHSITDKVVPVGATSFNVNTTSGYSVGDTIVIRRPSTTEWIHDIGMDAIPPRPDGGEVIQWTAGSKDQYYERTITRIEGKRIFIDAPVMNSFEQKYGGGTVYRVTSNRISNVGVEAIRGVTDSASSTAENHADTFIHIAMAQDTWVHNVTAQKFWFSAVNATSDSIRVTVDDVQSLDPTGQITGGRRYSFNGEGQYILMKNLYTVDGRHDFVINSADYARGPNVFFNSTAVNAHDESGPHQRWSTGTLWDNVTSSGNLVAHNRGYYGTGHGWAGANMVYWNCTTTGSGGYIIQSPPTAQNWAIGCVGTIKDLTEFGAMPIGVFDSHGSHITFNDAENPLSSLYLQQVLENQRWGTQNRVYNVGDYDEFEDDGSTIDTPTVDAAWQSAVAGYASSQSAAVNRFDLMTDNRWTPFTLNYQLDGGEYVASALLTIAVRRTGGSTTNDLIFVDSLSKSISFADLGLGSSNISTTDSTILMLEFLPGASVLNLATLNDGQLNLAIGNNVAVDWADISLNIAMAELGDANKDGLVNLADLQILGDHWQASGATWSMADFNGDGYVNLADLQIIGDHWGFGTGTDVSFDEALAMMGASIPEPAGLLLLSAGGVLLLRRHRFL